MFSAHAHATRGIPGVWHCPLEPGIMLALLIVQLCLFCLNSCHLSASICKFCFFLAVPCLLFATSLCLLVTDCWRSLSDLAVLIAFISRRLGHLQRCPYWSSSSLEALLSDVSFWDEGSQVLETWGSGVSLRWRPGDQGGPWCWRPGGRGFPDVGDHGVSLLSHTALWPPHRDSIADWTILTALSTLDVVWTCGDTMTSLQAPGAHCLLWISPRLFLVLQACGEPPIFTVLSRCLSEIVMNTNHQPVLNLVNFPSLFLIFSFIREDLSTHPSLTNAVYVLSVNWDQNVQDPYFCDWHLLAATTSHDERGFIIHLHLHWEWGYLSAACFW